MAASPVQMISPKLWHAWRGSPNPSKDSNHYENPPECWSRRLLLGIWVLYATAYGARVKFQEIFTTIKCVEVLGFEKYDHLYLSPKLFFLMSSA
jgi:hypothetical protein